MNDTENIPHKRLKTAATTSTEPEINSKRLLRSFYQVNATELAQELLGQLLVRELEDGSILKGKIVETEAYLGSEDKACHAYQGRRTPAKEPMYMQPGTTYVFLTYGIYHCLNISSEGDGAVVLIRAVEPINGLATLTKNRQVKLTRAHKHCKPLLAHQLCNGPSKLCLAFELTKGNANAQDLCTWPKLWIEARESPKPKHIVACPRIGIDSAGVEWASKHLRFYIFGNPAVSKRNRPLEAQLLQQTTTNLADNK